MGSTAGCACVACGHAAAPPRSVMNSRRLIAAPEAKDRASYQSAPVFWKRSGCPLWVRSRYMRCNRPCPLYPESGHVRRKQRCRLRANSGHPPEILSAYKLKEGRQSRRPDLFFCFSLFYSFLCRINRYGNLTPVIMIFDMTGACSRNG